MPPFAPFPLTPSELVYLNGEQYAKKHLVNNIKLMHIDQSVSASELAYAMLATAFLASEAEGALRLVVGKRKTLLGGRDELCAEPGSAGAIWPKPSLESKVLESSASLMQRSGNFISTIVYNLLDADCGSPGFEIIELCKPYMAQRNLAIQHEKKTLGIFTTYTYELPPATLQGARQFPMERISQMLSGTQQTRQQLWKMLIAGIKSGISQRVEKSSDDD
ncbi:MAG: hypothetical protein LLG44_11030 [Chloroflexi bacterium]|nr:hypothetical protein [Chloroflexota bacterium]